MPTVCAAVAETDAAADMKASFKVSLGGIAAALGLVLMFLTFLVPVGTYAFPAFAGILLAVIVIEIGYGYAVAVFAATALLSFLLITDKEAALLYAIFLGYYPILKSMIERIKSRIAQYLIKLNVFNITMIAAYFIAVNLLSMPTDSFSVMGISLPWLFLLIGNAVFVLYDLCVTRLVTIYQIKWHKKLNSNTKL